MYDVVIVGARTGRRDGIPPLDLLRAGREELRPYGIQPREVEVTGITIGPEGFAIALADGDRLQARTLLIAINKALQERAGLAVT